MSDNNIASAGGGGTTQPPGNVLLFGSGETAPGSQHIYDALMRHLALPIGVAILETPAGFQPNSAWVAERVAEFVRGHLQNYRPQVDVIPARKRGTPFSPDDAAIVHPMRHKNLFFVGPGSPTYAVHQLLDTLAWHTLLARHRQGAAVIFASAATVAVSSQVLPVYEIYKAGIDLHWQTGLDFFAPFGLDLVFVPHWNNQDGGENLDTSRCFMGKDRFARLRSMLLPDLTVVGIDEHTGLLMNMRAQVCEVWGHGGVTLQRDGQEQYFPAGQAFPISELGAYRLPQPQAGIPQRVWEETRAAVEKAAALPRPTEEVLSLVEKRTSARDRRDWSAADALREQIQGLGWQVVDTPEGPKLSPWTSQ